MTAVDVGRTEEDMAEGSSDVAAVAEWTEGEWSLAVISGAAIHPREASPYSGG